MNYELKLLKHIIVNTTPRCNTTYHKSNMENFTLIDTTAETKATPKSTAGTIMSMLGYSETSPVEPQAVVESTIEPTDEGSSTEVDESGSDTDSDSDSDNSETKYPKTHHGDVNNKCMGCILCRIVPKNAVETVAPKSKVYTRRGDCGLTDLFNNTRKGKDSSIFRAIGSVDSSIAQLGMLNSIITTRINAVNTTESIGLTIPFIMFMMADAYIASGVTAFIVMMKMLKMNNSGSSTRGDISDEIVATNNYIITILHNINASLSTPPGGKIKDSARELVAIDTIAIDNLEHVIDRFDNTMPELKNFVKSFTTIEASQANIVRTEVRKAERYMVNVNRNEFPVDTAALKFINRLSDYMFIVARMLETDTLTTVSSADYVRSEQ